MKPKLLLSTVVCALVGLPTVAAAQDQTWLRDRRYTEGPGYRVGDFELHPGAAAEFGYDTNYLRRSGDANDGPIVGSLRLRITPTFSISTIGTQRKEAGGTPPAVEFRGGAALTYNEFFPVAVPAGATGDLVRSQRNLGVNSDMAFTFFPGRQFSAGLNLGYMRALGATQEGAVATAGTTTASTFNRSMPRGAFELAWTPGAGLFEWRLGYQFSGTFFEDSNFTNLSSLQNTITTRGRWRFLPRTALVYDASFGFVSYPQPETSVVGTKQSSHPLRARLGINGLVTSQFAVLAMVGWGASFYTLGQQTIAGGANPNVDFDSVIGQAELKWFLNPTASSDSTAAAGTMSSISVGFLRDFYDSYIGNYYERDRGYVSFSYFFAGRFLLVIDGGAGPVIYAPHLAGGTGGIGSPGSVQDRFTNIRIDAGLFAEYRFKDQLGVNTSVRYNENIDKVGVPVGGGLIDNLSYRQIEAYLGFRWLM